MGRRILALALVLVFPGALAIAQPADDGGDIEMDPQDAGSGSGSGSGSAKGSAAKAKPEDAPQPPPEGEGSAAAPPAVVKDPKAAKKWQVAAVQLVQKGDYFTKKNKPDDAKAQYENAETAYGKAIEAGEDLGLHYDLSLVEEKLGKLDVAAREARLAAQAKSNITPAVQKKAQAKFDDLSTKIGVVTLTVNTEGATITLDGAELGKSPLPEPLIFMPGTYTLSFSADGYQPKDSEIKVEAGSESERAIELDPVKITVEPIKPDVGPVATPVPPKPSLVPVYAGTAVTGVFLVTGVVTGILAVGKHSTFVGASTTKLDREDAQSNGKTLAHVTDAMLAGAVVAGGFTAYWYFFKYKKALNKPASEGRPMGRDPNAPDITKVDVVPWVQPTAGGVSFTGSF